MPRNRAILSLSAAATCNKIKTFHSARANLHILQLDIPWARWCACGKNLRLRSINVQKIKEKKNWRKLLQIVHVSVQRHAEASLHNAITEQGSIATTFTINAYFSIRMNSSKVIIASKILTRLPGICGPVAWLDEEALTSEHQLTHNTKRRAYLPAIRQNSTATSSTILSDRFQSPRFRVVSPCGALQHRHADPHCVWTWRFNRQHFRCLHVIADRQEKNIVKKVTLHWIQSLVS